MRFINTSSPFLEQPNDVAIIMRRVIYALIPGVISCFILFGWGVLFNIIIASITALSSEALVLTLRNRPAKRFLSDGSALLTAILLAVALPALAPWWLTVTATAFAIIIAKHLYGGIGFNPFNPAMIGYVVALISFPQQMTQWLAPHTGLNLSFSETAAIQFQNIVPDSLKLDSMTMATPLDALKTQLSLSQTIGEISATPIFGLFGGAGWEWVGLSFLVGGCWLLFTGIIRWHIPVAMLAGLFITAMFFHIVDSDAYSPPLFHLFSGGAMLGAFFIATDPVTASTTDKGRIIYGVGIGVLTYIIRTWGGYPDGIAFAVLLMNMGVPTIDYYTQPKVLGARDE